jgi:hypothetical protein
MNLHWFPCLFIIRLLPVAAWLSLTAPPQRAPAAGWQVQTMHRSQNSSPVIGDWVFDRPGYPKGFYPHGVTILVGQARRGEHRVPLRLIPRFAWANRGVMEMTVCMDHYAE